MTIRIPTNTAKLFHSISKEVRRRKRVGLGIREQQDFRDSIQSKKILAPNISDHEYWQMVNDIDSLGFAKSYIRGSFALNSRGLDAALHPIKIRISSCRAEIIAIFALIISLLTGWQEIVTLVLSLLTLLSQQ